MVSFPRDRRFALCASRFTRSGFTLVELLATLVILGIMAVGVLTLFDMTSTDLDAEAKKLRANIRLAQDYAMTHGSTYGFRATGTNSYEIYEGTPGTPAPDPLTRGGLVVDMSPVAFQGAVPTFSFDATGAPDLGGNVGITLVNDGQTRTLIVQSGTGHVQIQ